MKVFRPAVLFACIAIASALMAYRSRPVTFGCGSDHSSGYLHASEPISPSANVRVRPRRTISAPGIELKAESTRPSAAFAPVHGDTPPSNLPTTGGWPRTLSTKHQPVMESGPYLLPQPAAWADPGDLIDADPERDLAIQQEAERLLEELTNSGLPADSPAYRALWDAAIADSDQLLRMRYGGWSWMAHHVQAHHLAAARQADTP
jgi:hypothetical protein